MRKILVSKCLLGARCRWDGKQLNYDISDLLKGLIPVAICPEIEGGLGCPRPKAEIMDGDGFDVTDGKSRVIDSLGYDVTSNFLSGARAALDIARKYNIYMAILKEKSPSCGVGSIYQGSQLCRGMGVAAALLKQNGIEVIGHGA